MENKIRVSLCRHPKINYGTKTRLESPTSYGARFTRCPAVVHQSGRRPNQFGSVNFNLACVQTSPISFHPRKRDVCETASLIVFQCPAVFQEFVESAFIGCLTIATVRNNSDLLSSGNARDNVCDLHLAGFFPLIKTCPIVCCASRLF